MNLNKTIDKKNACPNCLRPKGQCICTKVNSLDTRLTVLILQYPREQHKLLNSARLVNMALPNSVLRVGLSWPNLNRAAGKKVENGKWGVLYLGSTAQSDKPLEVLSSKKKPLEEIPQFEGFIALDGTWKQAKSLWWRNAWLLKLKRIVLNPDFTSMRSQVKREALSTAEAVALALRHLGEPAEICDSLFAQYETLIIQPNMV